MDNPSAHLGSSTIELFFLNMQGRFISLRQDLAILNQEEQARAARFHFERDRTMFVACRASLRRILAARMGYAPASIQFKPGAYGKPSLARGTIQFNVSHAGHWFACALSQRGPVGIDIEHVHLLDDMLPIAQQFFAPAEVKRLFAIPESARTRSFFECWTRKEAVIKATGQGVTRPLDSFEVAFGPGASPALLRLDKQRNPGWGIQSFSPAPDYVAALASLDAFEPVTPVVARIHDYAAGG